MSERRKKRKVYFILYQTLHTHKKLKVPFDFVCLMHVKSESVGRNQTNKRKKDFVFPLNIQMYVYVHTNGM